MSMAPKEPSSQSSSLPKNLPPLPDDLIDFTTMTISTVRYAHYTVYTSQLQDIKDSTPSPRTLTNDAGGSPVTVHMDLGNIFRIIS